MKDYRTQSIRVFILLLACLFTSVAEAQLGAITGNNAPAQLAITTTGHSQISWTMVETVANAGPYSISSSSGMFFAPDNTVLGTVTTTLQTNGNAQSPGPVSVVFNESLTIPLSIIRQAQQKGFNTFAYSRQFTDFPDNNTQSGTVVFSITGGGAGSILSIRRVAMEFDDGRISALLAPNSQIQARAQVSYYGTGLLEYRWEVASPPSTQGQPVFVPLVSRKQYLLAGGKVVLQTPRLPTGLTGEYLLRLQISRPTPDFNMPVLRYTISKRGQSISGMRIKPLQVARPAADAVLAVSTEFAWQPVTGASAYQLEIYTRPVHDTDLPGASQPPPLTGVLVPAAKTHLTVGGLSRAHLLSGSSYYWRVVALSATGQVIARSDFRRIQLP
ncbi:MAG TPA: hypothetical protein ENI97_15465 [Gammaproteobacteria bacterium]|nr:hypothetical protein [Gammaproteobacteria bacterium]